MQRDSGYKALLLGYVLPFILLMIVLITFLSIEGSELLAGILALLILVPYYTGLYFLRDRIKKTFSFSVSKI
jgi:sigma-E factor negative regulatory protein RseC